MAYVTPTEYIAFMRSDPRRAVEYNAADTALITTCLAMAEDYIETQTRRVFKKPGAATVRYYDSSSLHNQYRQLLMLDTDLNEITAITNGNGVAMTSDQWRLYPYNDAIKWAIEARSGTSWSFSGGGLIEVTGYWCCMATPTADVQRIVMRMAHLIKEKRAATGEMAIAGGQDYGGSIVFEAFIPQDIRVWIKQWRRDRGDL